SIKRTRDLSSAERSVCQETAVFAREWHSLSHTLINNIDADLRQAIDVCFPGPKISSLDRVVKEAVDAVTIIFIVLPSIESPLGGNGVSPTGTAMETKALNLVTQFGQRSGG